MKALLLSLLALLGLSADAGLAATTPPEWSQAVAPFRVAGPVWYVGTRGLAVYAIVTDRGAILVGGPLAADAAMIERNLGAIGVKQGQLKLILNTHAHYDHAGAFAQIRRDTGAKLLAAEGDLPALEAGRHQDGNVNGATAFPSVPVDRIIHDGEIVRLGGVAVTATLTPGHTAGCTTWSIPVRDAGRLLTVVFPCSISVAGNILVGNHAFAGIVADYRRSFARLEAMRADVVLPNHPDLADIFGREARRAAGDANAFVDPALLRAMVGTARHDFEAALAEQRKAAPPT